MTTQDCLEFSLLLSKIQNAIALTVQSDAMNGSLARLQHAALEVLVRFHLGGPDLTVDSTVFELVMAI